MDLYMARIFYIGGFELPDKNAAAQRVLANAKLLRLIGYEVSFIGITKSIEGIQSKTVSGFDHYAVPYPKSVTQWIRHICRFVDLSDYDLSDVKYVFLYNFPSVASLRIINICHKHGIKVIEDITEWESAHGLNPREIIRRLDIALRMHYCLKKMDGIIAISRYLKERYKRFCKTIILPPLVDLDDEKWPRICVNTIGEKINLVYAGIAGTKVKDRLDMIINAIPEHSNIKLNVVGISKDEYIASYGIASNELESVCFIGRVPHTQAIRYVSEADFQVIIRDCTRKNMAGFPTKFVESISACTPVIANLTSNIGDYLTDGYNGFIVDDQHPLSSVLARASVLKRDEIIRMKEHCKEDRSFDYRNYTEEIKFLLS